MCMQIGPFLWLDSTALVSTTTICFAMICVVTLTLRLLQCDQPTHRHLVSGFPWCLSREGCIPFIALPFLFFAGGHVSSE